MAKRATEIDLWETSYVHIKDNVAALVDWIKSTGLKPYLDRLPEAKDKLAFEKDFYEELKADYPDRTDGKVLFPFKRLFFIAYL